VTAHELTTRHLLGLERARASLGANGSHAKLLLFVERMVEKLVQRGAERDDVATVDLDRLHAGN